MPASPPTTLHRSRPGARPLGRLPLLLLLLLLGTSGASAAQEPGTVDGTITFNGEAVAITHAAIYAEEEGFFDPADPTWTLVLAAEELSPRNVDDPFLDPSLIIGITITSEFDDAPTLRVLSNTLYIEGASMSGGTKPTLEITSRDGGAWMGRVFLPEEQEFFDNTYFYDLAFHAPLLDPNAPIGDPLPEGGGEPGRAYLKFTEALHAGDLDALRTLVTPEMAAMLDDPEAAEQVEMMAMMTPTDIRVLGGSTDGTEALLQIEGSVDGQPVKGEVTLTKMGDLWILTGSSLE